MYLEHISSPSDVKCLLYLYVTHLIQPLCKRGCKTCRHMLYQHNTCIQISREHRDDLLQGLWSAC